ncbi:Putative sialic acid transporter [Rickettsia tillamookensis]|uniref:Sialic acid transporter n=1 Tax=Rickettsia tillamookensis TaxID=2761623 RepID=A0A9E6SQ83_9RICK|nr:MFS transporter [Rickettsia tillamookensis]QQV74906.1 Putative sialic acid transporter [Rickettsia tillamookensis]
MLGYEKEQRSLNKEQKQAVGLLSIGTFLEYFDLMLYVHMAVLLNNLFFPEYDPFTFSLLTAFSFCSTYLLRPIGALIFGYIGDHFGRKIVVVLTTLLMAITCVIIGSMPTYAQIGITASWVLTICRIIQGMSATAEARGAELYLTENSSPPIQYPLVAIITVFSAVGTTVALGIASIFTNQNIYQHESSWRIAFFVGATIAFVGTIARTSLKEADAFSNKKNKLKLRLQENNIKLEEIDKDILDQKVPNATSIWYFFIQCARPPCFYFVYIYCGDILKRECGFTPNQIINQNFWVSIIDLLGIIGLAFISYKIHPFKILKVKLYLFFTSLIFFPIMLNYNPTPLYIFIFQCLAALFVFDHVPAAPIFYKYFPVFKRFTYTSMLSAIAKLFTYIITSFGLVYITNYLGYWGLFLIFIPVGITFFMGVTYFEKMEKNRDL